MSGWMDGWMDGYVDGYNDMEMSMPSRLNGVIMVREVANGPNFECKAINTHTKPTDNLRRHAKDSYSTPNL